MRIISSFKDFYDCIQHTGIDKECVYLRDKKDNEESTNDPT